MPGENTNLQQLTPSRKAVHTGDVFAIGIDDRFFFGRVITTEAQSGLGKKGAILAYLFEDSATSLKDYDSCTLSPDRLLIAPFMINRLPWSRGYFETVTHRPLEPGDVLEQHCFESANGKFYDEMGTELSHRIEPCPRRALSSYRSVDDKVSARLGLPLAAD